MENIDWSKLKTKEILEEEEKQNQINNANLQRESKYNLTDKMVIEIIRKKYADTEEFKEVTELVNKIHEEIPIPK